MLQLLVVARGSGLTRGMLAGLSGLPPSLLGDALSRLRQYLVGPWPEGPLRVYHESLREYLVTSPEHQVYPEEGERALAQYLAAHPQSDYARAHRAAHAAAAGRLDELLCDAGAILTVEPRSVLVVLDAADTLEGRRAGEAYRIAYPRLGQGIGPLHLAALQVGAQQLVSSIAALPDSRREPWRPSWAWWRRPVPAQTVAALDPAEYSYPPGHPPIAAVDTEDGPVAVVATKGAIQSWDLERGQQLAQVAAPDRVRCIVDCGKWDRPVVAVGDDAGTIALLSVPGLETLVSVPKLVTHVVRGDAQPDRITRAVHLPASGLLATGDGIGTISLWTLPDLTRVACRPDAHTLIYSLATAKVGGEELLLSGGDTVAAAPGYASEMPSLRAWSIPGLHLRASELRDNRMTRWLGVIHVGMSVFVQVRDNVSEVWRLDPGAETFRFIEEVAEQEWPGYLLEIADGEGILVYGHELVPLQAKQAQPTTLSRGQPVDCEPASWSGPVLIHGRGKALVSASGKLRLWALRDIMDESAAVPDESLFSRQGATFVTKVAAGDGLLCAGTAFGSVHAWTTASTPSHQHRLSGGEITALAVASIEDKTYLVAGTWFGGLSLIDCASGKTLWTVAPDKRVSAVKIVHLAGRSAALAAVTMSHSLHVCRLWDLPSGQEIDSFGPPRGLEEMDNWQLLYDGWRLALQDWRRDKSLNALAAWQTPYGVMAAACCDASPIPIWLLEEQRQVTQLDVDIAGAADLDFGHDHLVACSGDRLYIWDASRQWSGTEVDAGHSISSVACGMYSGEPCIASGGHDGSVRMWRFDGSWLGMIDIDEKITAMTVLQSGRFAIGTQRGLMVIETS